MRGATGIQRAPAARACAGLIAAGVLASALATGHAAAEDLAAGLPNRWQIDDRRDPFEFAKPPAERPVHPGPVAADNTKGSIIAPSVGPATPVPEQPKDESPDVTAIRLEVAKHQMTAEARLMARDYAGAEAAATDALKLLADPAMKDDRLVEASERLRMTAQRLRERQEIENRFNGMKIDIQGVVWSPEGSVAVVEGKPRRVGDSVGEATIAEIRPGEVVFILRGVRIRKQVNKAK